MKPRWRAGACLLLCGVLIWFLADAGAVRAAAAEGGVGTRGGSWLGRVWRQTRPVQIGRVRRARGAGLGFRGRKHPRISGGGAYL